MTLAIAGRAILWSVIALVAAYQRACAQSGQATAAADTAIRYTPEKHQNATLEAFVVLSARNRPAHSEHAVINLTIVLYLEPYGAHVANGGTQMQRIELAQWETEANILDRPQRLGPYDMPIMPAYEDIRSIFGNADVNTNASNATLGILRLAARSTPARTHRAGGSADPIVLSGWSGSALIDIDLQWPRKVSIPLPMVRVRTGPIDANAREHVLQCSPPLDDQFLLGPGIGNTPRDLLSENMIRWMDGDLSPLLQFARAVALAAAGTRTWPDTSAEDARGQAGEPRTARESDPRAIALSIASGQSMVSDLEPESELQQQSSARLQDLARAFVCQPQAQILLAQLQGSMRVFNATAALAAARQLKGNASAQLDQAVQDAILEPYSHLPSSHLAVFHEAVLQSPSRGPWIGTSAPGLAARAAYRFQAPSLGGKVLAPSPAMKGRKPPMSIAGMKSAWVLRTEHGSEQQPLQDARRYTPVPRWVPIAGVGLHGPELSRLVDKPHLTADELGHPPVSGSAMQVAAMGMPLSHVVSRAGAIDAWISRAVAAVDFAVDVPTINVTTGASTGLGLHPRWSQGARADLVAFLPRDIPIPGDTNASGPGPYPHTLMARSGSTASAAWLLGSACPVGVHARGTGSELEGESVSMQRRLHELVSPMLANPDSWDPAAMHQQLLHRGTVVGSFYLGPVPLLSALREGSPMAQRSGQSHQKRRVFGSLPVSQMAAAAILQMSNATGLVQRPDLAELIERLEQAGMYTGGQPVLHRLTAPSQANAPGDPVGAGGVPPQGLVHLQQKAVLLVHAVAKWLKAHSSSNKSHASSQMASRRHASQFLVHANGSTSHAIRHFGLGVLHQGDHTTPAARRARQLQWIHRAIQLLHGESMEGVLRSLGAAITSSASNAQGPSIATSGRNQGDYTTQHAHLDNVLGLGDGQRAPPSVCFAVRVRPMMEAARASARYSPFRTTQRADGETLTFPQANGDPPQPPVAIHRMPLASLYADFMLGPPFDWNVIHGIEAGQAVAAGMFEATADDPIAAVDVHVGTLWSGYVAHWHAVDAPFDSRIPAMVVLGVLAAVALCVLVRYLWLRHLQSAETAEITRLSNEARVEKASIGLIQRLSRQASGNYQPRALKGAIQAARESGFVFVAAVPASQLRREEVMELQQPAMSTAIYLPADALRTGVVLGKANRVVAQVDEHGFVRDGKGARIGIAVSRRDAEGSVRAEPAAKRSLVPQAEAVFSAAANG